MKKQVAQFVPYADTLGKKVDDTTGMTPVNVGNDGKLYTEASSPVIDDFYFTSAYGRVEIHTKDGKNLSVYTDPDFIKFITDRKYYGKFAKAVITMEFEATPYNAETLLQMVYNEDSGYCTWVGQCIIPYMEGTSPENPTPSPFCITTGYTGTAFTVNCSTYSGV